MTVVESVTSQIDRTAGERRRVKYTFYYLDACDMCGSSAAQHRVLGKRLNAPQRWRPTGKIGITTTVMRCNTCGLIYANPLPVPERLEDHYGIAPETYWYDDYFKVDGDYFHLEIDQFFRLHGAARTGETLTALDIGAGIGKCMGALTRAGFDTYGIEPSAPFYRQAIERSGIPHSRLQLSAIENAEFESEMFDLINLGAVLEHLYSPCAALRKAIAWLKPGGLICIDVPSSRYLMSRLARLFYRATGAGDYVANICPMHVPYHLYEFDIKSFELHARQNGYEIAEYSFHPGVINVIPQWVSRLFNWAMRLTNTGMQLSVWLRKR